MFDAYEVAIKLRLVDGLTGAMGLVSSKLMEANTHATALQKKLNSIKATWRNGALLTGAGFGLAMVLDASTKEAIKLEQQMNRLKALNLGATQNGQLTSLANTLVAQTKGTSQIDALKLVTEAQAITGNVQHTLEIAPLMAKMRFGMEAYMSNGSKGEGHGEKAEKQFQDVIKVMEMRGLMRNFSEDKLHAMADLFVKNYVASGGQVKPSDFLAMMKTGGTAAKTVDQDFMFALGHIMQEKGGSRSGTALMSMYQNMVAGRMPQQVAETLEKLGLLTHSAIHYGKTGHITKVDPGGLKNSQLLMTRPDLYMQQEILPALAKRGVNMQDSNAVLMKLNSMTGQRTASDFLAQLYLEHSQIENYIKQSKNAMGVDQLSKQAGDSTVGKQLDLKAKLVNLEITFGQAVLPVQVAMYEKLIPLVETITWEMKQHPTLLKGIVLGLAGLAASLLITGPLMMFTAAVRGLGLVASLGGPLVLKAASAIKMMGTAVLFSDIGGVGALVKAGGAMNLLGASIVGLTQVAGAFAVAYAGWKVGGWLNEHVIDPGIKNATGGKSLSLGDLAYNWTHKEYDPNAATNSKFVRPGQGNAVTVNVHNKIDERGITSMVTKHQARMAGMPATAGGYYDFSMGLANPGMAGGG